MQKQILTIFLVGFAVAVTSTASAADLPKRKSGLWEVANSSSTRAKAGSVTMSMCVDQATDADWLQRSQQNMPSKCSKQDFKAERARITFSSVCNLGRTTATTNGVVTGDFDKEYKVETHSTYNPPLAGRTESSNTMVAKWVGPCKAGQRPGDVVMPNGMTMNMNDMMKMKK